MMLMIQGVLQTIEHNKLISLDCMGMFAELKNSAFQKFFNNGGRNGDDRGAEQESLGKTLLKSQ